MTHVSLDDLAHATRSALMHHGAAEWVADQVTKAVVEAEATGNRICGLAYLESYCLQLQSGRVNGHAEPKVTHPRPGLVVVDAGFGFAQAAFARGLPDAIEAARTNGIAALLVAHAHTATALGFFTGQIARAGMLGLSFTNATPRVAPPGGRVPVIGTNPVSFAVPDGQGGVAMLFDQSTTTVALGTVMAARDAGQTIPESWARDAQGRSTTDPAAALAGGSLASAGGYKGWGLGLMVEVMAAGLTGSRLSRDIQPLMATEGGPHDIGLTCLLIDPAAAPEFPERLAALASAIGDDEGGRMPGQHRRLSDPVEVPDALWAKTQVLAGQAARPSPM